MATQATHSTEQKQENGARTKRRNDDTNYTIQPMMKIAQDLTYQNISSGRQHEHIITSMANHKKNEKNTQKHAHFTVAEEGCKLRMHTIQPSLLFVLEVTYHSVSSQLLVRQHEHIIASIANHTKHNGEDGMCGVLASVLPHLTEKDKREDKRLGEQQAVKRRR